VQYFISSVNENVGISGPVHRAINDAVVRTGNSRMSDWRDDYGITIDSNGSINAQPIPGNVNKLCSFATTLTSKLVFLPTPEWMGIRKQKVYICFTYEVPGMMEKWWREYIMLNT